MIEVATDQGLRLSSVGRQWPADSAWRLAKSAEEAESAYGCTAYGCTAYGYIFFYIDIPHLQVIISSPEYFT